MSSTLVRDTAEGTVIAVVEDLIQDWGLDLPEGVLTASKVVEDLQFASVDIIQLCVALEQAYDRKFGFQDLLMKDGSYVGDLSLAQFARFIDSKLSA
ncbi:acyl carrier protein [Aquabacterium sp.]|uniref:acyl carrier protein n=1 Tax=Aquabacterium sp. TaxID=1872578 RepID=UPI0037845844